MIMVTDHDVYVMSEKVSFVSQNISLIPHLTNDQVTYYSVNLF